MFGHLIIIWRMIVANIRWFFLSNHLIIYQTANFLSLRHHFFQSFKQKDESKLAKPHQCDANTSLHLHLHLSVENLPRFFTNRISNIYQWGKIQRIEYQIVPLVMKWNESNIRIANIQIYSNIWIICFNTGL